MYKKLLLFSVLLLSCLAAHSNDDKSFSLKHMRNDHIYRLKRFKNNCFSDKSGKTLLKAITNLPNGYSLKGCDQQDQDYDFSFTRETILLWHHRTTLTVSPKNKSWWPWEASKIMLVYTLEGDEDRCFNEGTEEACSKCDADFKEAVLRAVREHKENNR